LERKKVLFGKRSKRREKDYPERPLGVRWGQASQSRRLLPKSFQLVFASVSGEHYLLPRGGTGRGMKTRQYS
jgi:hypothetical protein